MQLPPDNHNLNTAFVARSHAPKRTADAAPSATVKPKPMPSVSGQQRHESVSTPTVGLEGRPNKNSEPASARGRPEISFDQLIDAIQFSHVDRAAAQARDLALNMQSLSAKQSWVFSNQHQPSRNLIYSSPSARELGNVKRSSGSVHSGSSTQQQQQQQPIKDGNNEKKAPTDGRYALSSTRIPTQNNAHNDARYFDMDSTNPATSTVSLFTANSATSPRFAAISSGIKRKNNPPKKQSSDPHGKPTVDQKQTTSCNQQQPKVASTELFLLPTASATSSSSNGNNKIEMLVCSLNGLIDGIATGSSTDASRYLKVGVFLFLLMLSFKIGFRYKRSMLLWLLCLLGT